jgi:hypothetical protein
MVQFFGFLAWCLLQDVDVAAALGLPQEDDDQEDWTNDRPFAAEPRRGGVVWEDVNDPVDPPRRVPDGARLQVSLRWSRLRRN